MDYFLYNSLLFAKLESAFSAIKCILHKKNVSFIEKVYPSQKNVSFAKKVHSSQKKAVATTPNWQVATAFYKRFRFILLITS